MNPIHFWRSLPFTQPGSRSRGFPLEEGTAMFLVDGEMVQMVELRHQVAGGPAEPEGWGGWAKMGKWVGQPMGKIGQPMGFYP